MVVVGLTVGNTQPPPPPPLTSATRHRQGRVVEVVVVEVVVVEVDVVVEVSWWMLVDVVVVVRGRGAVVAGCQRSRLTCPWALDSGCCDESVAVTLTVERRGPKGSA